MSRKTPFTVKSSLSLAPWMSDGLAEVRRQLDEANGDTWWRKPHSKNDVIRLAVTEFLESRGIVDPGSRTFEAYRPSEHAEVGKR